MYVCGITPYDSTHLGHAATYLAYDLLARRLEDLGHEVRMVRNVTDVDDSIRPKARELGVPYLELAEAELTRFRADMNALGMHRPVAEPRATEEIPGMIAMIGQLLDAGHAYLTHGTVYFDVSTFPRFGQLSHYSPDHMLRLAAARGGRPEDPHRRDPLDSALWRPPLPAEPAWRTPRRPRRPPSPTAQPAGPAPRRCAHRVRAALDRDLGAPRAVEALDDLASAVLSGGDDPSAPTTLRDLGALLGVPLDQPVEISTGA